MDDMPRPNGNFQPTTMLSAVLEAQEWNLVFAALNELPMKVSRPVFDKLMVQFNQMRTHEQPQFEELLRQ